MGTCTGINGCCGHCGHPNDYEFSEIDTDPNSRLTLTANQANNTALIKCVKLCSKKIGLTLVNDYDIKNSEQNEVIGKLLKLKVLSGNLLPGSELIITPYGFESGHRKKKDGYTYFGCKKRNCKNGIRTRHGEVLNDVVVKLKEKGLREAYRGRHFRIRYGTNSYWIKDLGVGFGTFMKIQNPLRIQDGMITLLGESFLAFNLIQDGIPNKDQEPAYKLKVTIYAGDRKSVV